MIYELWDVETANLVRSYGTEAEAVALVREAVARHGAGYVEGLALLVEDANGDSRTIAHGDALLEYVDVDAPLPTLAP